jgi:hypothetical protein
MITTIALKDNYAAQIVPDAWDKNIKVCLVDEVNNVTTVLAIWQSGRWVSDSYMNLNKFFELINSYPKLKRSLKRAYQYLKANVYEANISTWSKTFSCFRRRVNIKMYKLIKH